MSQPTKCIFNGKILQSKICTVVWVVCQKAKFALNFISMMLLHVLGAPQRSQWDRSIRQTIISLFGYSMISRALNIDYCSYGSVFPALLIKHFETSPR